MIGLHGTCSKRHQSSNAVNVSDAADEAPTVDSELPAAVQEAEAPEPSASEAPTPTDPTHSTPVAGSNGPKHTSTPRSGSRRRSQRAARAAAASVIDLTTEEEEGGTGEATPSPLTTVQSRDMKPDVNELNRQMQQNGEMEGVEAGSGTARDGAGDLAARVKVKEEEDTRLGHLRHKYKLLTQRFNSLQRNVHKLLSFIVPDVDLGSEDDIEHIVTEMIRVNCNQESS